MIVVKSHVQPQKITVAGEIDATVGIELEEGEEETRYVMPAIVAD
jgi:hypothetical protein